MDYAIHFGALSESVEEQLKKQGYTLGDSARYIKRLSYNGYYPSLPSWRRGFDSRQPLQ